MESAEGARISGGGCMAAAAPTPVRAAVLKKDWALRSVIKVFVVKVDPSYAQPWQKLPQRSSSGSAFVLDTEKRLIITNAHVVGLGRLRCRWLGFGGEFGLVEWVLSRAEQSSSPGEQQPW